MLSSPIHQARNITWIKDILFLSLFILIIYTLWLGNYPLFTPDEGRYSEVAREMVATGDYITPRVNGVAFLDKPILYYWLQSIAIQLFGIKEWALRLFPMLFSLLGCLSTYFCGRLLFNRRTALIATLILATTPLYFVGAHYANLDLEVAVFINCTLLFFLVGMHNSNKSRVYFFFAAYSFAALAFLTKGLIGIVFPILIIGTWIALLNRWYLLKQIYLPRGILIFLMITLPWYILVEKANPGFFSYFFINQQFNRYLSAGIYNNPMPIWFYLPIVLLGFFPWTSFIAQATYKSIAQVFKNAQERDIELYLLLSVLIIFIFFSVPSSKIISYIYPIFSPLALLVGSYLAHISNDSKRIKLEIMILGILSILLGTTLFLLSRNNWGGLNLAIIPLSKMMAYIFILLGLSAFLFLRQAKIAYLLILIMVSNSLLLLTFVLSATYMNQDTAKPLITILQTKIKPEDEVATYYKYYQDIPLYLGKNITIVADWQAKDIQQQDNWKRELWYGLPFQKTDGWLINDDLFIERWQSQRRMYLFVNKNYFTQFSQQVKNYYLIAAYNDILLFSNKNIKQTPIIYSKRK